MVSPANASALEAAVVLVVANRGILLGPCLRGLLGDSGTAFLIVLDLVTRVLAGALVGAPPRVGTVLTLLAGGAMPNSGRTSPDSSESSATRFAIGVLRGWPGGAMSFAFAAAVAICRLGVTGGKGIVLFGGVVCMESELSSISDGGVAGVTTVGGVTATGVVRAFVCISCFFNSSIAAHFVHSSCFRYIYCC